MKTIFVIDSDPALLKMYAQQLSAAGIEVVTFRSADLAVKALEKLIPSCVVLDLALPVHNGFEFLYELRSYADTRDTKVIVYTLMNESDIPFGYVTKQDLGITAYMHKASDSIDDVIRAVKKELHADD